MKRIFNSVKARLIALCAMMAVLLLLLSPLSIVVDNLPSILSIGNSRLILRIGNPVHASGTLDYGVDGTDDDVQFTQAIAVLTAYGGGEIVAMTENYSFSSTVLVSANITIRGLGISTYFAMDGVNPLFEATGNNAVFQDLATDAGGINVGATTGWMMTNVQLGTTYYAYRSPYGQSILNDVTVASLTDSGLTSGRVPIAGVGGLLGDDVDLTWTGGDTLSINGKITINNPYGIGFGSDYNSIRIDNSGEPNVLAFYTSGVEVMRLGVSGAIGIFEAAPTKARFQLSGNNTFVASAAFYDPINGAELILGTNLTAGAYPTWHLDNDTGLGGTPGSKLRIFRQPDIDSAGTVYLTIDTENTTWANTMQKGLALGSTLDANSQSITGVNTLTTSYLTQSGDASCYLGLTSVATAGKVIGLYTSNSTSGDVVRFTISTKVDVASMSWTACKQIFDTQSLPNGDPHVVGQLYVDIGDNATIKRSNG